MVLGWAKLVFCPPLTPPPCSKACVTCGCSGVNHVPGGDAEDDQHMGRLLAGSPCSHLTTKVKGGGGLRTYKRNRMIVTNPVVSRKDPTFNTTTYDWAPASLNQTLVSDVGRHPGGGIYHRGNPCSSLKTDVSGLVACNQRGHSDDWAPQQVCSSNDAPPIPIRPCSSCSSFQKASVPSQGRLERCSAAGSSSPSFLSTIRTP